MTGSRPLLTMNSWIMLICLYNSRMKRFPDSLINPYGTVILIEYSGDLETVSVPLIIDKAYSTVLDTKDARINGSTLNYSFNPVWGKGRGYNIYDWYKTDETVEWKLSALREGEFDVELKLWCC